jgi:GT2 family glycosyltransferase
MCKEPDVTIAVPSYQQGHYLEDALASIFRLNLRAEVIVCDGGSSDRTLAVIRKWKHTLTSWRSHPDRGQAAAVNEGIAKGCAPYVGWLNSDDMLLPGGLPLLMAALEQHPDWPAAYGRARNMDDNTGRVRSVWVEPFDEARLALRCIISQPASLVRRSAWEAVGGLDEGLHLAMDYDLWWRLYRRCGPPGFVDADVAIVRQHPNMKSRNHRRRHYAEAISLVRKHHGRVPMKWWVAQPYAVWFKAALASARRFGASSATPDSACPAKSGPRIDPECDPVRQPGADVNVRAAALPRSGRTGDDRGAP